MVDFFRVLPIQFGSLTRDLVVLVMGAGVGLGDPRLVGVRADLSHPLTPDRATDSGGRRGPDHRPRASHEDPLYPVATFTRTPHAGLTER